MRYKTIYDISTVPHDNWIWFIIAAVFLVVTGYSFGLFTTIKPGLYQQRYWVIGFGLVVNAIAAISYWDFHRLRDRLIAKDYQELNGVIQDHWEKEWVERGSNGRQEGKHYEGFTVNGVKFGYYINGPGYAGFQNSGPTQVALPDGLPIRICYITDKHIDDGSLENRILKFEIVQL